MTRDQPSRSSSDDGVPAHIELFIEKKFQDARESARIDADRARNQALGILGFVAVLVTILSGIGISEMIKVYSERAVRESVGKNYIERARAAALKTEEFASQARDNADSAKDRAMSAAAAWEALKIPTSPWIDSKLEAGWQRYTLNLDTPYNPPGYYKDRFGIVHLRGMIQGGSGVIFVLPKGYRPQYRELHTAYTHPNDHARVDVLANGEVQLIKGSFRWVSLDGIDFKASE